MKKLNYLLSVAVLLAVLLTTGCGKDDGPAAKTVKDLIVEKLSKKWTLSTATLDGNNSEGSGLIDSPPLTVTFDKTFGYKTNSSTVDRKPNPWSDSGNWEIKGEPTKDTSFTITRKEDKLDITVDDLTETSLTLTFTFDKTKHTVGGRNENVNGKWVMGFTAPK